MRATVSQRKNCIQTFVLNAKDYPAFFCRAFERAIASAAASLAFFPVLAGAFRAVPLCLPAKADVLDASEKANAAPAKSCAAITMNHSPLALIPEDYVDGCTAQYPLGAREPSCRWRMCRDTSGTPKKSEPLLRL